MYKPLSLFLALFFAIPGFSQRFINKSPKKVLKILSECYSKKSINTTVQQTDSTISFFVRDPKVQNLTIEFRFDRDGKCDKERYLLSCDSCYTKFLNGVLNNRRYHWLKVSEQVYTSKPPYRLTLWLEPANSLAYSIVRSTLSRGDYKAILNNAEKK